MDLNGTGDLHVLVRRVYGVLDIALTPIVFISPSVPLSMQWYKNSMLHQHQPNNTMQ